MDDRNGLTHFSAARTVASTFGILAGIGGLTHGIGEILPSFYFAVVSLLLTLPTAIAYDLERRERSLTPFLAAIVPGEDETDTKAFTVPFDLVDGRIQGGHAASGVEVSSAPLKRRPATCAIGAPGRLSNDTWSKTLMQEAKVSYVEASATDNLANTVTSSTGRKPAFDYLRSFVIVFVVWHHAVLAYAVFTFINPANPIQIFSPVVDSQRWIGFDFATGFNDTFFMALMFFISGLFVSTAAY
jgi:hypothetical protein